MKKLVLLVFILLFSATACDETLDNDSDCAVGSEGCACTEGGSCDDGLDCLSNLCVDPGGDSDTDIDSDSDTDSDSDADSDSDTDDGTFILRNDDFEDGDPVYFQGGFVANEEGAATLGPVDEAFIVNEIQLLFGGSTDQEEVSLIIYEESGSANPGTVLYEADYDLTGSNDSMQVFDLTPYSVGLTEGGSIRVSVKFTHEGYPCIARDGVLTPNVNWINAQYMGWIDASSLGVTGDWIIRAEVTTF